MKEKSKRIKELVKILNEASRAYYQGDREIMSNLSYDTLYDELLKLESETGIILSDSPSINVGYEILSELPKEVHESVALSLDKTKEVQELKDWLNEKEGILSWKLDGLTIILTYKNGQLFKAVTRGNGEIGEVVTNNAIKFKNIPLSINYKEELIIRGEAIIKYSDFNKINDKIGDTEAKYKNPRNLCSGSVRQLNNEITSSRNVNFFAFSLVKAEGKDIITIEEQFKWLNEIGFDTVEWKKVDNSNIEDLVEGFGKNIVDNDIPSDGLVLTYNDISYGRSLGSTSKFPRDSIAFKWADEQKETILKEIEWSASRTGLINPIAIFESVELEGTIVSRASVHNISILEELALGYGDIIKVYKANMIIPQIAENITRSGTIDIPSTCPVCNSETKIKQDNDVKSLYCTNVECTAKKIKSFTHFVSRDAMNIEGLSEATIEKFIANGLINNLSDLFYISKHKEKIINMEGFGEKSYANLLTSIEKGREVTLAKFIYSLGIPNIGLSNAKLICKEFNNDIDNLKNVKEEDLLSIGGIGDIIAKTFVEFFDNEKNINIINDLYKELKIIKEEINIDNQPLNGITFVITGSVEKFTNRNELKNFIETKGGKVTGSVTSKTNYLINNDNASNSSKNKKAKELMVEIITEEEFIKLVDK